MKSVFRTEMLYLDGRQKAREKGGQLLHHGERAGLLGRQEAPADRVRLSGQRSLFTTLKIHSRKMHFRDETCALTAKNAFSAHRC